MGNDGEAAASVGKSIVESTCRFGEILAVEVDDNFALTAWSLFPLNVFLLGLEIRSLMDMFLRVGLGLLDGLFLLLAAFAFLAVDANDIFPEPVDGFSALFDRERIAIGCFLIGLLFAMVVQALSFSCAGMFCIRPTSALTGKLAVPTLVPQGFVLVRLGLMCCAGVDSSCCCVGCLFLIASA